MIISKHHQVVVPRLGNIFHQARKRMLCTPCWMLFSAHSVHTGKASCCAFHGAMFEPGHKTKKELAQKCSCWSIKHSNIYQSNMNCDTQAFGCSAVEWLAYDGQAILFLWKFKDVLKFAKSKVCMYLCNPEWAMNNLDTMWHALRGWTLNKRVQWTVFIKPLFDAHCLLNCSMHNLATVWHTALSRGRASVLCIKPVVSVLPIVSSA